jgi:hypothetical protein
LDTKTATNPFKEIDLVDAVAEVIASKIAHQVYEHFLLYGPGRITDLEHNQEHIYVNPNQ